MVFAAMRRHTASIVVKPDARDTMEVLSKIAAIFVTLLLYCVIAILQTPRTAHAAPGYSTTAGHASLLRQSA